jgi:hypothetical protein
METTTSPSLAAVWRRFSEERQHAGGVLSPVDAVSGAGRGIEAMRISAWRDVLHGARERGMT